MPEDEQQLSHDEPTAIENASLPENEQLSSHDEITVAEASLFSEDEPPLPHEKENARETEPDHPAELIWPPAPRPRPRQGLSTPIKTVALVLAMLLVSSGLGLVIFATTNQYNTALATQQRLYLKGTVDSQATIARSLQTTAQPLATTQAQIYATATAQGQATTTSQESGDDATATATTLDAELTQDTSGTPVINDTLFDNSMGHNWDTGYADNNNTGCNFVNGGYEAQEALQGFIQSCYAASTNYSNFVYQVTMTINGGEEGGILLYGNKSKGQYYLFNIDIKGNYSFALYNGNAYTPLAQGNNSAIMTGTEVSNDLTVIADKGTFSLFVNETYLASAHDTTLKGGQIGVSATNTSLPTTVDFTNAEVWTLPPPTATPTSTSTTAS